MAMSYRPIQQVGFTPEFFSFMQENPFQVGRGSITGRVGLSGEVIHIPDVLNDPEYSVLTRSERGKISNGFRRSSSAKWRGAGCICIGSSRGYAL